MFFSVYLHSLLCLLAFLFTCISVPCFFFCLLAFFSVYLHSLLFQLSVLLCLFKEIFHSLRVVNLSDSTYLDVFVSHFRICTLALKSESPYHPPSSVSARLWPTPRRGREGVYRVCSPSSIMVSRDTSVWAQRHPSVPLLSLKPV